MTKLKEAEEIHAADVSKSLVGVEGTLTKEQGRGGEMIATQQKSIDSLGGVLSEARQEEQRAKEAFLKARRRRRGVKRALSTRIEYVKKFQDRRSLVVEALEIRKQEVEREQEACKSSLSLLGNMETLSETGKVRNKPGSQLCSVCVLWYERKFSLSPHTSHTSHPSPYSSPPHPSPKSSPFSGRWMCGGCWARTGRCRETW